MLARCVHLFHKWEIKDGPQCVDRGHPNQTMALTANNCTLTPTLWQIGQYWSRYSRSCHMAHKLKPGCIIDTCSPYSRRRLPLCRFCQTHRGESKFVAVIISRLVIPLLGWSGGTAFSAPHDDPIVSAAGSVADERYI